MKLTLRILILALLSSQSWGMDYVQKAFQNDDHFFRNKFFLLDEKNPSLSDFRLPVYQEEKNTITLLSRVTLGAAQTDVEDLTDAECEQYKQAFSITCSKLTDRETCIKIQQREEQIAFMRKMGDSEKEVKGWIEWFKEKDEWGPIIDKKSQSEANDFLEKIKKRTKTFLLKHTMSSSKEYSQAYGVVALYPGTNPKILEDDFYFNYRAGPLWCIGDFDYTVSFSSKCLHGNKITINAPWLRSGYGYAIACYLTNFSLEHFSIAEVKSFTVSCRHSVSAKIFEKCGFDRTDSYSGDVTHGKSLCSKSPTETPIYDEWNKALRGGYAGRYGAWFDDHIRMILANEFHKIGYKYF